MERDAAPVNQARLAEIVKATEALLMDYAQAAGHLIALHPRCFI